MSGSFRFFVSGLACGSVGASVIVVGYAVSPWVALVLTAVATAVTVATYVGIGGEL